MTLGSEILKEWEKIGTIDKTIKVKSIQNGGTRLRVTEY
jgi:hypothetical protein